jgi:hypothetical protein
VHLTQSSSNRNAARHCLLYVHLMLRERDPAASRVRIQSSCLPTAGRLSRHNRVHGSICRFACKDHWLEPHKESRAFKELKAWQGASGIQVGLMHAASQTVLLLLRLLAARCQGVKARQSAPHPGSCSFGGLTHVWQAGNRWLTWSARPTNGRNTHRAGSTPLDSLFFLQVTTTGQSYNETDIGYLTPGERGLMQQQAAAGTQ